MVSHRLGIRVQGIRSRVQGLVFRVHTLGCRRRFEMRHIRNSNECGLLAGFWSLHPSIQEHLQGIYQSEGILEELERGTEAGLERMVSRIARSLQLWSSFQGLVWDLGFVV